MDEETDLISTTLRIDNLTRQRADAISRLIKRDRSYLIRLLIDRTFKELTTPRGRFRDDVAQQLDLLGLR